MFIELLTQGNKIAARLRHGRAVHQNHSLVQQTGEWLFEIKVTEIVQCLGEESCIKKVQNRVRYTADILVDRRPSLCGILVEGVLGRVRRQKAQEIPRRIDERIHGVGVALGVDAALRALNVYPIGRATER